MVPFDHPGVSRLHRFGRRSSRWSSSPTTPPASPSASRGQPHGLADDRRHPRRPRVPHTPTSPSVPSQRLSQLVGGVARRDWTPPGCAGFRRGPTDI